MCVLNTCTYNTLTQDTSMKHHNLNLIQDRSNRRERKINQIEIALLCEQASTDTKMKNIKK